MLGQSRKGKNVVGARSKAGDGSDPVDTLERLIGTLLPERKNSSKTESGGSEDTDVDFGGLGLHELATAEDIPSDDIHVHRSQTIEEYDKDKAKFEDLHRSIRACDDVLKSVETNLASFQSDLGQVSAEIETLQGRSTALSIRLENRITVEKILGPVVEEISLSPAVIRKIAEGAIDEGWVRALAEVEKRSKALDSKAKDRQNIKGVNDLRPLLQNLVHKALERIRDFLVAQIKGLRSPNINAQIIQQQHFLKYRDLYSFLYRHHETLAGEISQAYMNTVRWYYLNQFTRYRAALEKLHLHIVDKNDLLGHQDDGSRKASILTGGNRQTGPPHDVFNLGRRIDILRNSTQPALTSYLAEEDKNYHYLELPFRNFNIALIDNASAEYSFLTSFFGSSLSLATISRNFNYIFEPTFKLGQDLTRSLVNDSVDCLGLLICVRLNQHSAFELQRRKIPAMDGYINGTSMLLWPRFQVIMDMHCTSLRTTTTALPNPPTKISAAESAKQSAAPHFLIQRFGRFLAGILALSTEAGDDEPVSNSLARLRVEVEALLSKLARGIGEVRKRERFWENNWSLVLTIVGDLEGKLAEEQRGWFEGMRDRFHAAAAAGETGT